MFSSIIWFSRLSIIIASIMHQHTKTTNVICMEILYLKIIHRNRLIYQLDIKIFNQKNISVYIKEFIANKQLTSLNKPSTLYIKRVRFS